MFLVNIRRNLAYEYNHKRDVLERLIRFKNRVDELGGTTSKNSLQWSHVMANSFQEFLDEYTK